MDAKLILMSVVVQITLVLLVFIELGRRKAQALKTDEFDRKKAALDNRAWSDNVVKVFNNIVASSLW